MKLTYILIASMASVLLFFGIIDQNIWKLAVFDVIEFLNAFVFVIKK